MNPVWNYTFAYDDVSLNELSERALELTIWDHDRLASNEFLGGVRFSLGTGKFNIHICTATPIKCRPRSERARFCWPVQFTTFECRDFANMNEYVDFALRFANRLRLT